MSTHSPLTSRAPRCAPTPTPVDHPWSAAHHQALRALFATWPEIREGLMFGHPAWFVGRHMVACICGDGVGLKLPAPWAAALRAAPHVSDFRPYGKAPMREWVQLHRADPRDYALDREAFAQAVRFATERESRRQS